MASLPPFILTSCHFQPGDEQRVKTAQQLKDFTTSSLAEAMINFQLDKYFDPSDKSSSPPSLASIAVNKILETLADSVDPAADIWTIAESLNSTTLRQLLSDPRVPYQLLRTFLTFPQTLTAEDRRMVDVDEAVLRNEQYVRSRNSNRDGKYLVPLEDLFKILSKSPQDDRPLPFTRQDPPKGGLELLDERRKRDLTIQPSSASFCKVFERITHGALRGIDWSNVLIAGGIALITLLHTDPSKDNDRAVRDPAIDVCIYGLGPEDANRKVEHIYDTWVRNLPATAQRLVVKNAKTITLIPSYPHRRIQIILKLLPSFTDVLLDFDLDACAVGFDGSRVLMLPRCARAIETGYSVFTMDLIWGHYLSDRRAAQRLRILQYADHGFGLRILPSYARSLEEDNIEATIFGKPQSWASAAEEIYGEDSGAFCCSQSDRKPNGRPEPGLKTLKRIAYLGQDFVRRFYFGATPLAISQQRYYRQRDLGDPTKSGVECVINQQREHEWREAFDQTAIHNKSVREANHRRRALGEPSEGPVMNLAHLDIPGIHTRGPPESFNGLGNFEIFMRHCEAWRLHALGEATLDARNDLTSLPYDPRMYDDFPDYVWNEHFRIEQLESTIESSNNLLWEKVQTAICEKLEIPFRSTGCESYFLETLHFPGRSLSFPQYIPHMIRSFLNYLQSLREYL